MVRTFTRPEIESHLVTKYDDGADEIFVFDSLESYITYCDPELITKSGLKAQYPTNGKWIHESNINVSDWIFDRDKSRSQYLQRVRNWEPYPEVVDKIEAEKSAFLSDPRIKEAFKRLTAYRRSRRFNISEGELVLERVMAGDPEYYQETFRKRIKKGIKILLNFSQSCGQDYATFAKNTIDMFKITYVFELMGIPVQILSGFVPVGCTYGREHSATLFILKHETESINLQKAALVACPGMLRYHGFAGGALFYKHMITGSYGRATFVKPSFAKAAGIDFLIGQDNKADRVIDELLKIVGI
jgi:hypothetical protein